MRVIGFHYTKINAERMQKFAKTEKINSHLEFTNVESEEVSAMKESEVLKISFKYTLTYEPKNANINLEGIILVSAATDIVKESLKSWKKKQLVDQLKLPIINLTLNKCSLKALNIEEELNLPSHMKLVNVSQSNKDD